MARVKEGKRNYFMSDHLFTEDKAVVFDLEFTSWPGSNERNWSLLEEDREIIQIGATKIEMTGNMREVDSFQILVRPLKNPVLSDYFVDLTSITQEKVEKEGVLFPLALSRFINFIGEFPIDISSNGADEEVIEENCKIHDIAFPSIFAKAIDLKYYFSNILGISQRDCISGELPKLFGLNSHEKLHDALGDARSISQALRYLRMKKQA
jgi:inhibitor of KinA sporulation pathway (predicted exonuclease)